MINTSPRLSVIIPCVNEADYLPRLLGDLVEQDIDEPFVVIVADSSSDDGTLGVAERFGQQLDLHTTNTDRLSAGHTRNAGADIASGEYLLFLDADCRLHRSYLRTLMAKRDATNADMMGTRYKASSLHPFDRFMEYFRSLFFLYQFKFKLPLMAGCGQFTTARLHQRINGYKSEQKLGEDWDYAERLRQVAARPEFLWSPPLIVSSRRYAVDGRINTLLLAAEWAGGTAARDINHSHKYRFGHYNQVVTDKIRARDLLQQPRLMARVLRAVWTLTWSPLRWR